MSATLLEAADLAMSGRLEEAAALLRREIEAPTQDQSLLSSLHSALGDVLGQLRRTAEATAVHRDAVAVALGQAGGVEDASSAMARLFLGRHLLAAREPEGALAAIEPALGQVGFLESDLQAARAEILWALDRGAEAASAAAAALTGATSNNQRERIAAQIQQLVDKER